MKEDYSGIMMKVEDIDEDGYWTHEGEKVPLVGSTIPIPESARPRGQDKEQEVILLLKALEFIPECPSCEEPFMEKTPILVTVTGTKMIPAHCCNTFIWIAEKREYDGRNDR